MSEFERELLNKVSPHDRTHNGNELFLGGVLAEHFKDWQPPKELVEVPQRLDMTMTTREIVQNYQIKLMKIIFKEIDILMTKKEDADINTHKLAENGYSVRTSAYWKSVGNAEFYIKEIYQKLSALAEIDRLFHWSDRLHQEQLKFVSKYPEVMEKYRQTNIAGQ